MKVPILFSLLAGSLVFICIPTHSQSLKSVFEKDFSIGTALNAFQIKEVNQAETKLITEQFNAITPENVMKSMIIHPAWNTYNFEPADQLVAFATKYNMSVHGHTLIWHSQMPAFARQIQNPDSFRTFFQEHIHAVTSRYKGKIGSWDVVNEALNEDGSMRRSIFLEKLGEYYVVNAFRLAEQAAPGTALYYNDYNNEMPLKRKGCMELIKKIRAAGVRIDGVGIQGHWQRGKVPFKEIEESIITYHEMGLKVMITELDIEMLPRKVDGADVSMVTRADPVINPFSNGIPDHLLEEQAKDYAELFRIFLKHSEKIERVTFWGVHDGQSWLNNWPVRGRTNYPLLFDRSLRPKPAFHKIIAQK